jgi:hypothetical protein
MFLLEMLWVQVAIGVCVGNFLWWLLSLIIQWLLDS